MLGVLDEQCVIPVECIPALVYWEGLISAIEAAQLFSRQQIDESRHLASSLTKGNSGTISSRRTTSERTATGKNCSWQTATSEQSFTRTSNDDAVAFQETNSLRTAETTDHGYDKSSRNTTGSASTATSHHMLDRSADGEALLAGDGTRKHTRSDAESQAGGTSDVLPYELNLIPPVITLQVTPPFITFSDAGVDYSPRFNIPFGGLCPPPDPNCDPLVRDCCVRPNIPSMGRNFSYSVRAKVAINILVFSAQLDIGFGNGISERMFYTRFCANRVMTDAIDGRHASNGQHEQTDNDTSLSRETTALVHLARRVGTSTRRGTATTDAEDRHTGDAIGVASNNSERDGKGFGHAVGRSESLTVGSSVTNGLTTHHAQALDTASKFGQIASHLAELHDRIMKQIIEITRMVTAVPYGAAMNCAPARRGPCNRCTSSCNCGGMSGYSLSRSRY